MSEKPTAPSRRPAWLLPGLAGVLGAPLVAFLVLAALGQASSAVTPVAVTGVALSFLFGLGGYGLGRRQRVQRWPEDQGRAAWVRMGGLAGSIGLFVAAVQVPGWAMLWVPLAVMVALGSTLLSVRLAPGDGAATLGRALARLGALILVFATLSPVFFFPYLPLEALSATAGWTMVTALAGIIGVLCYTLGRLLTRLTPAGRQQLRDAPLPTAEPEPQPRSRGRSRATEVD